MSLVNDIARSGRAYRAFARPVSVRIGLDAPRSESEERAPGMCIVGIWPTQRELPWVGDPRLGPAIVRHTRVAIGDIAHRDAPAVVHLRIRSIEQARALPGLDQGAPSKLRDSARVALTAGAPEVDVVLLSAQGFAPWDFDQSSVLAAMGPFLGELHGSMLLFPDLMGPDGMEGAGNPNPLRVHARLKNFAATMAEGLRQSFQVALLDLPRPLQPHGQALIRPLLGVDAAICSWLGAHPLLESQGWRSAAAFTAGLALGGTGARNLSLVGSQARLPPPRYSAQSREMELSIGPSTDSMGLAYSELPMVFVQLSERGAAHVGELATEPTLRQPIGEWTFPALREVKEIHRRLVAAASRFVFDSVDDEQAIALTVALRRSVREYTDAGLLVGPGGSGPIDVRGGTLTNPAAPGLTTIIQAQLRPWAQRVNVAVSVRADNRPILEVL